MSGNSLPSIPGGQRSPVIHPLKGGDAAITAAARAMTAPMKGLLSGTGARAPFDDIMNYVPTAPGVHFAADTVGGVPGWWCHPANAASTGTILYLHGGWYSWGSAKAYRNFVGQVAARVGISAFIPDYRLAPEHPFPAGLIDAQASYGGLIRRGMHQIAIVGDSAGGGLALALAALLAARQVFDGPPPAAVVALSPVTDLALSGQSWQTRASVESYFTESQAKGLADAYLGTYDARNPFASPMYGAMNGLPPLRIQVGGDEVLLDDALRFAEKAADAGVDARVDVWEGLPHVFQSSIGQLAAADEALDAIKDFIIQQFAANL